MEKIKLNCNKIIRSLEEMKVKTRLKFIIAALETK